MYPAIQHISEILPAVDGDSAFRVVEKDCGYTYINYNHMGSDVFPPMPTDAEWEQAQGDEWENHVLDQDSLRSALRRECRGIAFNTASGFIASRPFHKFFNAGEREEVSMTALPFNTPHVIMDKMDGSMMRPFLVADKVRWGTKMGPDTDVAKMAQIFAAQYDKYENMARACMELGVTPIFEYVSKENRIVVSYPKRDMVLLAIRETISGVYWSREDVLQVANAFDVPVVDVYNADIGNNTGLDAWDTTTNEGLATKFVQSIRQSSDIPEGVVLWWPSWGFVKVKTEEYVDLHRAKEKMATERNLITVILSDTIDDLLPLLDTEDQDRLTAFVDSFWGEMNLLEDKIETYYEWSKRDFDTKRGFAVSGKLADQPHIRSLVFALWDGKLEDSQKAAMKALESGLVSETKWREIKDKWEFSFDWNETEDNE